MKRLKKFKSSLIILAIQTIGTIVFWFVLPYETKIPVHWGISGKIDSYADKTEGLLLFLGINILLFLLFYFMPKISPKYRKNKDRFKKVLPKFAPIIIFMLAALHLFSLYMGLNPELSYSVNIIFVILGISFILIGNLLPKLPSNFYMGIRTPWSLTSEENWRKTSRFGGYAFITAGILFFIRALILSYSLVLNIIFFIIIILSSLSPIIYSFYLYTQEKK